MKIKPLDTPTGVGGKKLLDQVRDLMRKRHYSLTTEKTYIYWIRHFIFYNRKQHPSSLALTAISDFLTYLARVRQVAPSTQNQALCALVFLYQEILNIELGDLPGIQWATPRERIPTVLSREEVGKILVSLQGDKKLIAALLYGAGLRLAECLRLRRKDIDFKRNQIAIWDSKSMKDRVVMLPAPLREPLIAQLKSIRPLWEADRSAGLPGVELPYALSKKYPRAGEQWKWFWVFPSQKVSHDPRTGIVRRHHLYEDILQDSIASVVNSLGIEKHITSKTFRHSFATHLIDDGTDIRTVQTLLGHKDLRTTMIYTHVLLRGPAGVKSPLENVFCGFQQTAKDAEAAPSSAPPSLKLQPSQLFKQRRRMNKIIHTGLHTVYRLIKGMLWLQTIPREDGSPK